MSTGEEAAAPAHPDRGLAHGSMTQVEVLSQSVAGIAPSAVMATGPALIVLFAGQGAWLSYVAATVVVVLVGLCVAQFGRRFASSGSLYSYVARGLGPTGAFAAGWSLVIGYLCIAMLGVTLIGPYLGSFLDSIGLPATSNTAYIVITALTTVAAAAFAIAGIRISTRVGLVLEVVSVAAVLLVLVVVVVRGGDGAAPSQFDLSGTSFDGVTYGIVLAVLGFVGFESAASLGAEARDPHRTIPRAVVGSAVLVGLLYVFATYASVLGFGGTEGLSGSAAPVSELAAQNGLGGVTWLVDLGVTASFFAVAIASINAASRVLYTMGEEDVLPRPLGRAHPRYKTPHVAIGVIAPVIGLVPIVLMVPGRGPLEVYAYVGTVGTFGYMVAYLLMAAALPFFLRRRGEANPLSTVLAVVVVAALLYVFYKNVVPSPAWPLNLLPWIYLATLALGMAWYLAVRVRRPEVAREVGSTEEEPVPPVRS
ncbi:amino acid/polyamine/organocation transporter, APC superfamily [Geodermatophilus pulveris]|uniref:Amino acid/polyamine/organocation transporter, APC superfamily n=1 Tax=Geodermatophilus pulveris TaxID=1564159 RepID=A0A239DVV0_9ACTN|nr:APC family permease [Geodermatophilus pulveris]SNS36616.1 amino acid/polyamine/organocation transporter, APC superfamily [Geodermatophilus pulveris]